jgi:hypothetical protein
MTTLGGLGHTLPYGGLAVRHRPWRLVNKDKSGLAHILKLVEDI